MKKDYDYEHCSGHTIVLFNATGFGGNSMGLFQEQPALMLNGLVRTWIFLMVGTSSNRLAHPQFKYTGREKV